MSIQKDSRNSAIVGKMVTDKPPNIHIKDKQALLDMLRDQGINRKNVVSIRWLGNRIIGSNAGKPFVLC